MMLIAQTTIHMEKKGNVYYVPGKVNGLPLEFIFDTGASNVCLSLTEAYFMLKNGYITRADLGGSTYSQIANGDVVENVEINIKELEIGGIKLYNIPAVIVTNLDAPLLFGQSAIQKLGPIQLDGNKLIISNGKDLPSNETAFNLYQQAYQQVESQNYEDAIKNSKEALKYTQNKELRGLLYDNMGTAYNRMGDSKMAIQMMQKALEEDYMCIQAQYNLGVYLNEDGQYENSLRAFQLLLDKTKNGTLDKVGTMDITNFYAPTYSYMGDNLANLRRYKEAEESFLKAISLEPFPSTYLSLADLYATMNLFDKAAYYYELGTSYEPERPSNIKRFHQMGMCYVFSNNYEKANEAFKKCTKAVASNTPYLEFGINSDNEEMQDFAAMCYSLGMDAELWIARSSQVPEEIISGYEKILSSPLGDDSFIPQDFLFFAAAYEEIDNPILSSKKSKEIIEKGIEKFPDNPDLLFMLNMLLEDRDPKVLGNYLKILEQEYTYKPINFYYGTVYNNIAYYYYLNQDYPEALSYALTAIKKNPDHDYIWQTLGEIYFELGQYQNCIEAMTKCIDLEESDVEDPDGDGKKNAYDLRGKSYRKLGKKKEAVQDENKVKSLK